MAALAHGEAVRLASLVDALVWLRDSWRVTGLAATALLFAPAVAPAKPGDGALSQLPGKRGCVAYKERDCAPGRIGGHKVVLSPDQRFLYVASGELALAGYRRDRETGRLRPVAGAGGCITATAFDDEFLLYESRRAVRRCTRSALLGGPSFGTLGMAISPDGRHLYVAGNRHIRVARGTYEPDAVVLILRRNRRTGALRQIGCLTESGAPPCVALRAAENGLEEVAISPDGESVYVGAGVEVEGPVPSSASSIAVLDRDPVSGALAQLEGSAGCLAPPGYPGCGSARGLNEGTSALALSPDGRNLYLAGMDFTVLAGEDERHPGTLTVFRRDPGTGALAQLAGEPGCLAGDSRDGCARGRHLGSYPPNVPELVISPDGRNAYAIFKTSSGPGGLGVYRRDPATGALTELRGRRGCLSAGGGGGCTRGRAIDEPEAVTVSEDGRNVYVTSFNSHAVSIFLRRLGSGALRQRRGRAGCIGGLPGPPIPGPLGGVFNVDQGCADGAVGGTDLELTPDGVYGYAPGDGRIVTLARNAPRIRVRIRPHRCLTADSAAAVAVTSYAPLRRVTVRLDGRVIAKTRRHRFRVSLAPRDLSSSRSLSVVAADIRGRLSHAQGTLRTCVG